MSASRTAAVVAALLLGADAWAPLKLPVPAPRPSGRTAVVRRAEAATETEAERLMAQAAALKAEVDAAEREMGIGDYAPADVTEPAEPLKVLSAEEIQQKVIQARLATTIDATTAIESLDALKESGDIRLWSKYANPKFKATSLSQLQTQYGLDAQKLGLAAEDSLDELKLSLAVVTAGSSLGAIASLVFLPGNLGSTLCYLFAVVPIFFLGIGSTAPGLISAVIEVLKVRIDPKYVDRRYKHEAGHFLAGYLCGLPIAEYDVTKSIPEVVLYETRKGNIPADGVEFRVTRDEANALSVVALSGAVAEVESFGTAKGGQQDLELLNKILSRCDPRMSPNQMQDQTRWAAAEASRLLKENEEPLEALVEALRNKATIPECIALLETVKQV